jgi:thiamine biosynthesis lipoprotein
MGTHLLLEGFTTPTVSPKGMREAFNAATNEMRRLERLMTTWRSDSEVSHINSNAGRRSVRVSLETFLVIKEALKTSSLSGGAFDITFESLHGLWKFDEDLEPTPPSEEAVAALLPLVNFHHVVMRPDDLSVELDSPNVRIGLGGIAKGYAVDMASSLLDRAGVKSFFIQAGGDLFTRGRKPDGSEWVAGIRDPRGSRETYFAALQVSDHAFSTAGDYERAYIFKGERFHHIMDPRTGFPARACRSVTIWAPTALQADAIDDAVFVLGPQKGMELVESLDGVGAVIVDAKNNLWISDRLRGKVALTAVPSDGP